MILKNFSMIFQNITNKYNKIYILRIFVLYYYIYITVYYNNYKRLLRQVIRVFDC